jgi:hypothetical protein
VVSPIFPGGDSRQVRRAATPPNARTRRIYDNPKWTGYDVVLDVAGGLRWGVLLLPKDLKPGEKRPVVVCQHGRRGIPAERDRRRRRHTIISPPTWRSRVSSVRAA